MTDGLLPGVDRDLVQPVARRCEKLFAEIRLNTQVTPQDAAAFDRVLVAVGRRPASGGLGLETTRARPDARGFLPVDEQCRTADPHVRAVGDVTGEPMLAHRACRRGAAPPEPTAGGPGPFDNSASPPAGFPDPGAGGSGPPEPR